MSHPDAKRPEPSDPCSSSDGLPKAPEGAAFTDGNDAMLSECRDRFESWYRSDLGFEPGRDVSGQYFATGELRRCWSSAFRAGADFAGGGSEAVALPPPSATAKWEFVEGFKVDFALKLNALMVEKGVTKAELSRRSSMTVSAISSILRGDRSRLTIEQMGLLLWYADMSGEEK